MRNQDKHYLSKTSLFSFHIRQLEAFGSLQNTLEYVAFFSQLLCQFKR